jgi:serine/threonine protein kinase
MKELYTKVTKGKYPDVPKHFSKGLSEVIGKCLNKNPKERPSAEDLLNLPAFGGSGTVSESSKKMGMHRRSNSQVA